MIAVLLRDLKLSIRSGGGFGLALVFFLIVITLVPLSIGPAPDTLSKIAPGVLWLGALLACLLSVDRIFGLDAEDGTLDALTTSPVPLEAAFIAKALAHWITTGLPLAVAAPLLGSLLFLPPSVMATVFWGLIIGTPALSCIGAFGGALTVGVRRGGLLLSLLILPLFVPTLIFGATAAQTAMMAQSPQTPMMLLAGITLFSFALFPFAAAAALRINLR